jgi:transcriptional regulator with XRE-family HTH domain
MVLHQIQAVMSASLTARNFPNIVCARQKGAGLIASDQLYVEIGRRIRQFRESQSPRMSQEELAKILGLTRTSITNIEAGQQKITLDSLYLLCERFRVEISDVVPTVASISSGDPRSVVVAGKSHDVGAKTASVVDRLRPSGGQKQ